MYSDGDSFKGGLQKPEVESGMSLSRVECFTAEPFTPPSVLACEMCGHYDLASLN